ncbi:MAG: type II toxin-antitoxin system VapC family toxin [Chitinophagaceae bacterium]|jgi:predicted nucleic acid-binding protein
MKIFLDTSSLCKLYYKEPDSFKIEELFIKHNITGIYLSELTKLEFISTVWKKVRIKEIDVVTANQIINFFISDYYQYIFIEMNRSIIEQAKELFLKYGTKGLRTLDSIQFATCIMVKNDVELFKTSDELFNTFLVEEGLPT